MRARFILTALAFALAVSQCAPRVVTPEPTGSVRTCEIGISVSYTAPVWTLTDVTYALGDSGARVQTFADVADMDAFVIRLRSEYVVCSYGSERSV